MGSQRGGCPRGRGIPGRETQSSLPDLSRQSVFLPPYHIMPASLSCTWAEVSRLSSLVDPEHTPLRSKEISVDIIREALAARNVRSSDCKPSLIP